MCTLSSYIAAIINYFALCTLAQILSIFKSISYSERGSNLRRKEENTFSMFVDYLDECEKGEFVSRDILKLDL